MMIHAAALVLGLALQAPPDDPNTKNKPEMGFSFSKPPKNDEWAFKDQGFFQGALAVVAHKVDELIIEVLAQEKAPGAGFYDPKEAAEALYKSILAGNGITEAKKIDARSSKLPGGGGANVQANYVELTFKKDDKPMEGRIYSFVGKQNQNLYRIFVVGEAGMYKKHQRVVDFILSTVKIYKVK